MSTNKETIAASNKGAARVDNEGLFQRFLRGTELDARMLGMLGALLLIWGGFHLYGEFFGNGGRFLTPRNLWNLSVQTASVGIMATGMVLVIVTRHIDLSVGSILGFTAMSMAIFQTELMPALVGAGNPVTWIATICFGLAVGTAVGGIHGYLIAYLNIPAFIVTLGGLLVWRGATFLLTRGETISNLDSNFVILGGGPFGSIGALWSIVVGLLAAVALVYFVFQGRSARRRFNFPQRPLWGEGVIIAGGLGAIAAVVAIVNSYPWPKGIVRRWAEQNNIDTPVSEIFISHGFAIPVLILIVVGLGMTFLMTRTKFGRYVFAIGGNPEAAELAGIATRWVTMRIFMLMGALCALSAVVASARLKSATNNLGTLDELYVIAAAVIGGTSFQGGIGTIYGAILGAVVMQSLQSGMVLIGFDAAIQQIVVGGVLVAAVFLDGVYRRRAG